MKISSDLVEFIEALNLSETNYLLVGGYCVMMHGYSRMTGDLDIWVERSKDNYLRLKKAFEIFKMPVFDMTEDNFLYNNEFDVYTFGNPPICIDILTDVKGLTFEESFKSAFFYPLEDGIKVRTISYTDLIISKKVAGRHRDLNDIENLENQRE